MAQMMPLMVMGGVVMCLSSSVGAALMMGGDDDGAGGMDDYNKFKDEDDDGTGGADNDDQVDDTPTEYVYEFIVKEMSPYTNKFNIHITDIRADGERVASDKIEVHQEPEWAKCNSKANGYECEGENYGFNDPEPENPSYADLTWSGWKDGQGKVGDKIFTMTFPSKVKTFSLDYFRPKYIPGWTIKENGVEVISTSKGPNEDIPNPTTAEYVIP